MNEEENKASNFEDSVFRNCTSTMINSLVAINLIKQGLGGRDFMLSLLLRGSDDGFSAS